MKTYVCDREGVHQHLIDTAVNNFGFQKNDPITRHWVSNACHPNGHYHKQFILIY